VGKANPRNRRWIEREAITGRNSLGKETTRGENTGGRRSGDLVESGNKPAKNAGLDFLGGTKTGTGTERSEETALERAGRVNEVSEGYYQRAG